MPACVLQHQTLPLSNTHPCRVLHQYHTCCNSSGLHGKVQGQTFRMESANFITQDTSRPLNARLATTMTVTQS